MISGTLLLTISNGVRLVLQFATLPILARLLGPDAYGVIGLSMPFIVFVNLLADGGLGGALMRVRQPSELVQSTVFWVTLALSSFLAVLLALAALPIGWAFERPQLTQVMIALAPVLVFSGLGAVPMAAVLREQRLAVLAQADVLSSVLAAGGALTLAVLGFGVWALVAQQLALWIIRTGWLTFRAKVKIHARADLSTLRGLAGFGANNIGAGLLDLAARNLDNLLVGAWLGVNALGHYAMAYQLSKLPELAIVGPLHTALYPAVSAVSEDMERVRVAFLDSFRRMAMTCVPLLAGLAAAAAPFTATFLGPQWADTAIVLTYLAPASFVFCFLGLTSAVLFGLGRADVRLRLSAIAAATSVAGIAWGAQFSISGVAIGLSTGSLAALGFAVHIIARHTQINAVRLLMEIWSVLVAAAAMVLLVELVEGATADLPAALQLLCCVAAGAATYVSVLMVIDRRRLLGEASILLMSLRRPANG